MLKHEIIRTYLLRFPDHADLTMAKKIYAENPLVWNSMETVRSAIRGIKGKKPKQIRHGNYTDKSLFVEKTFNYNPYKLPDSE